MLRRVGQIFFRVFVSQIGDKTNQIEPETSSRVFCSNEPLWVPYVVGWFFFREIVDIRNPNLVSHVDFGQILVKIVQIQSNWV